ncbi:hypothetical protein NLX83_27325 [Allokutzneria sp. A3M-2-11 16]|uniref:hypothetical protein n=1 Tax=Allokutzneria sp. A3M-2-11 16 TaxID=2962043 RepID=UPI0020B705FA|nr:hypothetical protein [Allokutzneria sp. A3M-2-11 16]MCP3802991.1 hypothetical protein [Allokutzneria sp. A3M-2-11 16]
MIRPLWTEYRRGAGIVLTPVVAVLSWAALFRTRMEWPGPWTTLAERVHGTLFFLAPLVVAVAAWQASRERRRGTRELLGTTTRVPWRRLGLTWASITLGATAGLLVPLVVGGVLVVWHGGYGGGNWWWSLLNSLLAIGFFAAFGMAFGAAVPSPLLGVTAGVTVYFLVATAETLVVGFATLFPFLPADVMLQFPEFRAGPQALLATWFVSATVALLALVSVRPKRRAAVPVGVAAVVAAIPLGDFEVIDERADDLVCQDRVCTVRAHAHLLDKAVAEAKPLLDKVSGIPGAPTSAMPDYAWQHLRVYDMVLDWYGERVRGEYPYHRLMVDSVVSGLECDGDVQREFGVPRMAAVVWWTGDRAALDEEPRAAGLVDRLLRLDVAAQREWFARYLSAIRRCDRSAVPEIP